MTAQGPVERIGSALSTCAIILASSALSFLVLDSGVFEPNHSHIKEAVAAELRDSESAQFQGIFGEGDTWCGEVNARNGLGGYSGFRSFVHHRGIVFLEPQEPVGASVSQQADYYGELARFMRLRRQCYSQR